MKISKKLKQKIFNEFGFIMGIVAEGLGSQYGVYIDSETKISILEKKFTNLNKIVNPCESTQMVKK